MSYANFTAGSAVCFEKHVRRSAAVVYTNAKLPKAVGPRVGSDLLRLRKVDWRSQKAATFTAGA